MDEYYIFGKWSICRVIKITLRGRKKLKQTKIFFLQKKNK